VAAVEAVQKKYNLNLPSSSLYREWLNDHPKVQHLSKAEIKRRFIYFKNNVKTVKKLNSANAGKAHFDLNDFSHLTPAEFRSRYLVYRPDAQKRSNVAVAQKRGIEALPSTKDWRKSGKRVVGPVADQGQCGSCWAFAAAGAMEGAWALAGHSFVTLSKQELKDCVSPKYKCSTGGSQHAAIDYAIQKGLHLESAYKYVGKDEKCRKAKGPTFKFSEVIATGSNDITAMMTAIVDHGPITGAVDADVFQHYSSGVISKNCGTSLNHVILIVGYGSVSGTPVWIVKNSWGSRWGENGYVNVARGNSNVCGINVGGLAVVA